MTPHEWPWLLAAIIGLTVTTIITRGFFLFSDRNIPMPAWFQRGLKYAPLAALCAVIAPEILMNNGQFLPTWKDAKLLALPFACGYFFYKRGILGTILTGMAVYLPLRIGLGW